MSDTDNWDMFAHTCRGSSFLYTVVMSRPTSFVETYTHMLLALRWGKTLYYQNLLGCQCVSIIRGTSHSPLVWQQSNLLFYAFIYVSLSTQVYKFVTLFCISALLKLQLYLHTYYISNAGCLKAFDQAVKTYTYKQTRGPVANRDSQFTSGATVQCSNVYPSARPDLKIRNRQ
jgi:hypothetical protein